MTSPCTAMYLHSTGTLTLARTGHKATNGIFVKGAVSSVRKQLYFMRSCPLNRTPHVQIQSVFTKEEQSINGADKLAEWIKFFCTVSFTSN